MNVSNIAIDSCAEELEKISKLLPAVVERLGRSAGPGLGAHAAQALKTLPGQAVAGAAGGGLLGGATAYDAGGNVLTGAAGGALLGAGAGVGAGVGLRRAAAARGTRQAQMVEEAVRKRTATRLGPSSTPETVEKFVGGRQGGRLRAEAAEKLKGTGAYENLFPRFPGASALLAKAGF